VTATIIDGIAVAAKIRAECRERVKISRCSVGNHNHVEAQLGGSGLVGLGMGKPGRVRPPITVEAELSGTSGCREAARAISRWNCQEAVGPTKATAVTGTVKFGKPG
jgi:hypothetical protein